MGAKVQRARHFASDLSGSPTPRKENAMRHVALFAVLVCFTAASASASILNYGATLSGAANASPGTGSAQVAYNNVLHTLHVQANFTGLQGTVTASHIHAATLVAGTGTAGVATTTPTFAGFPSGVTSGTYDNTLDLTLASSYNPSYVTANGGTTATAELALMTAMADGKTYFNIHTTSFPGGEISGFLTLVPEPGSLSLLAGAAGMLMIRRRR
jgi:hypothetical protein